MIEENEVKKILILHDYKGFLATAFRGTVEKHEGTTMDIRVIQKNLTSKGYKVKICQFVELDLTQTYSGWYVLYASSEEKGQFYKGYIEDILLRLQLDGAILIPEFKFFRAHANKAFQEYLRMSFANNSLKVPSSLVFGSYDELLNYEENITYPCVIKSSSGSGSSGVVLAHTEDELKSMAKKLMVHSYVDFTLPMSMRLKLFVWRSIKIVLNHKRKQRLSSKLLTNKIILQQFIPGLDGDYKVLYFYGKYYILNRKNRKNDFRASGSGKFVFPTEIDSIRDVLEMSKDAANEIDQPLISLDICKNENGCYLIEYQCVFFGPYTLQYSPCYFTHSDGRWLKTESTSVLEDEYCRAIDAYIHDKNL